MSNVSRWRKHRLHACRKCGVEENLTAWFTIWLCPEHLPTRRCLDCHKTPTETAFFSVMRRRCMACEKQHLHALHDGYKAKAARKSPPPASPHVRWVRTLPCLIHGTACRGGTAHHVRTGTGGGTALRPEDCWCVPLCHVLHMEGHDKGWLTFEAKYGVDLRTEAIRIAAASPFLVDKPAPVSYSEVEQGAIG